MERKEIIKALGDHFAVKPKYMGAPSFAYQFEKPEGTYSFDQSGRITTSEGNEVKLSSLLNVSGATNEGSDNGGFVAPVEPEAESSTLDL